MNLAAIPREFKELPIGSIDDPANPSRTQMDEQRLDELTASILAIGLQQPLIVARVDDRFEVLAGHRRLIAAKRAGLVAVPCIVYPGKGFAHDAIQFAENRHREDLNAADEAIWFSELLESACHGDVDELCEHLNEKRAYVEGRLLLFSGDELVFARLREGKIKIGIAQQLNRCTNQTHRRYLLHQAIVGGATVAVVSGWIADWQREQRETGAAPALQSTASPPSAVPQTNYFTCVCCGGTDNVHLMQAINVHQYCKLAILDKLLAAYRGDDVTDAQATDPRRI